MILDVASILRGEGGSERGGGAIDILTNGKTGAGGWSKGYLVQRRNAPEFDCSREVNKGGGMHEPIPDVGNLVL